MFLRNVLRDCISEIERNFETIPVQTETSKFCGKFQTVKKKRFQSLHHRITVFDFQETLISTNYKQISQNGKLFLLQPALASAA